MLFYRRALAAFPGDPFLARELDTRTREVGEALAVLETEADFTQPGRQVFETMQRLHAERSVDEVEPA